MFEDAGTVIQEPTGAQSWDRYEEEISEAEWLADQRYQQRAEQVTDLTDSEAITELVELEASLAAQHARRARLVAHVAGRRPAAADRPADQPGAAATQCADDQVPEVLDVSEWLPHELQMAHPYSWSAVQDLVETSLVLTARLPATLELLRAGRIDYVRARIIADLLGTCTEAVAQTVEALVLPKAPELTPSGLSSLVRRVLARIDAQALRRRHARARRAADVGYYPTSDGMARFYADLPLPVAASCVDAIRRYAGTQQAEGDDRPIGQIRTEVLSDLILRPWDLSRPAVSGEVTIHLTIPTTGGTGAAAANGLDDAAAQAEVDGHPITAAQCRELLSQLHSSRLFLALHGQHGGLQAVASHSRLRRAARRRERRRRRSSPADLPSPHQPDHPDGSDPDHLDRPGLRPPPATPGYRPTAEQDRHVRTRDRTCRHFGCTRKAVHADLDHHQPHPDGPTAVCNLCCYCRTHHRLKHQAPGWTRDLLPDATLRITTPTGITRTTRPPGPEPDRAVPAESPQDLKPGTTATPATRDDDPPPF